MSQSPKRGLGRGFEALISQDFDKSLLVTSEDRVEKLPLDRLQANPQQPRRHFDDGALAELSASIERHGVIQPVVVNPASGGKYTLVAGERRWRASQLAGLETIPAIVRSTQEQEQLEIALIENVQRVDLNPLDQAISIERLHQQFSLSYDEVAKRLGKAVSTVHNTVRLLGLPDAAREALVAGQISEGHARAILALKNDATRQAYLLKTIVEQGWSVRQAERFVTSVKAGIKEPAQAHARAAMRETPVTQALSRQLGHPVTIHRSARGGKLELGFKSDAELDELITLLQQLAQR